MRDEDEDDSQGSEEEVREALLELATGEGTLQHVLALASAASQYETRLVPPEVVEAVTAVYAIDRDFDNGGLDQFVWNHGAEVTRAVAASLRAVGALENPDVLERLAAALERQQAQVKDEESTADPVAHFLAFRRAVGGPEFGIPSHCEEAAEALLEYVLERVETLPAYDAELRRAQ